jgi:hexosaminidase
MILPALIPLPAECRLTGDDLVLRGPVLLKIEGLANPSDLIDLIFTLVPRSVGVELTLESGAALPAISFAVSGDEHLAREGSYSLSITRHGVTIRAGTELGLTCGAQTLSQLIPPTNSPSGEIALPGVEITDFPRFGWRGMHLDVSRHFFPIEFIRKYIDLLARHKMNIFHWHLVDDQGWRIESKHYPRLTEIGAFRREADGARYGGFYTQDEVRDTVSFARKRGVTVVPEIEMPGHALAALAAYPEFSCTGGPFEVPTTWGVFDDVFCAGREETFGFLQNILDELIPIFPGPFFHIGGDECPKERWRNHDLCLNRMHREGLADQDQLQANFTTRIGKFLDSRNRRLVGWDEILDGGISPQSVIMAWRGADKGVQAAQGGHEVIMCPMSHCYFDHYQARENEPHAIGGFTPLERVYEFEPVPDNFDPSLEHLILGAQGNVWTEYMPDSRHVEYMALPRICAMAERLWSPKTTRSLPNFVSRLVPHLGRLEQLDVHFRPLDTELLRLRESD